MMSSMTLAPISTENLRRCSAANFALWTTRTPIAGTVIRGSAAQKGPEARARLLEPGESGVPHPGDEMARQVADLQGGGHEVGEPEPVAALRLGEQKGEMQHGDGDQHHPEGKDVGPVQRDPLALHPEHRECAEVPKGEREPPEEEDLVHAKARVAREDEYRQGQVCQAANRGARRKKFTGAYSLNFLKISAEAFPPNPEFRFTTFRTGRSLALPRTRSTGHPGSGYSRFAVGGMHSFWIESAQISASTAAVAPTRCPVTGFVPLTAIRSAAWPNTDRMATASTTSLLSVAEPWALIQSMESSGTSPAEGALDGLHRSAAPGMQRHHVVGVAGLAVRDHLAVDPRPSREGVAELLQDEERGSLPEDEAVAVPVERPHGPDRRLRALRHQPELREYRVVSVDDRRLGGAREYDVGHILGNGPHSVADRIVARRTGRADRCRLPLNAQLNRQLARASPAE